MEPLAPCQRKNPYPSPYSLPAGVGGTREQCLCGRWWQPPDPYAVDRVGGAVGHSSSSAGGKGRGAGFHPTSAVEVEPTEGLEPGGAAEPQPERAESLAQVGPRAAGTEAGGWRRCNCSPQSRQDSVRSVNKYEPRALGGRGSVNSGARWALGHLAGRWGCHCRVHAQGHQRGRWEDRAWSSFAPTSEERKK